MPVVPEPDMDETHNVDNNDVSGDECTVGNGYHKSGNGISNGKAVHVVLYQSMLSANGRARNYTTNSSP